MLAGEAGGSAGLHGKGSSVVERAAAKVNLTLRVTGRRPDGYHELDSLVAFARTAGDIVVLDPDQEPGVAIDGRFGNAIVGINLVGATLDLLRRSHPELRLGRIRLTKSLPVAAGLGGGSADAAAALRAVRRLNADIAGDVAWTQLAARLGADVPVCLASEPARMHGIGERLSPVGVLPRLPIVLVNPLSDVPTDKTSRVFRTLQATATTLPPDGESAPDMSTRDGLLRYITLRGNDLEAAASLIMPAIPSVKRALAQTTGCLIAALTGAGPTCFGLFESKSNAVEAAAKLASDHPGWWIRADEIGG